MKFVDQARIIVRAGKGGDGCVSFRRERFVSHGGPDGGDGGDGGSIYLITDSNLNTLVDFRSRHLFKAMHGEAGKGKNRTGKKGEDIFIPVAPGTLIYDDETRELIGDLVPGTQQLIVARGGYHGLGNTRFKSATNRTPRQSTQGEPGDERTLFMELKLLADVGLVGLPNAGKSTLVSTVSAARPKIADYPFTTLTPMLGVVKIGEWQSFVMADLPGLIKGAASGAGLSLQFLKHIQRTRLLLHIVDIGTADVNVALEAVRTVEEELANSDADLITYPRWLVCTKTDLLDAGQAQARENELVEMLAWTQPVFSISAASRHGLDHLTQSIMTFVSDESNFENSASTPA